MDDVYFGIDGSAEASLAVDGGGAVSLSLDAPYVGGSDDYGKLRNKPSIEGVELIDDKLFPELGVFERDGQGYDVPDKYTLSTLDINSLWETAIPIGG